jgi:predicted permease
MRRLRWLVFRLRAAFDRSRRERDLDAELRHHIEREIEERVAAGMPADVAAEAARRTFGNPTLIKEASRTTWVWNRAEDFIRDVCYGARSLRRDLAFTLTSVTMLTLGVGFVACFVTVFNGTLLKPWPLPHPEEVVTGQRGISAVAYRFIRDQATTIDLVAMAQTCGLAYVADDVRPLHTRCVSSNYFTALGVPLARGRGFRVEEDIPGAPVLVAVIGHGLWRDRFQLATNAIGRPISLNGLSFQIVGIAAEGATDRANEIPQIWLPLAALPLISPNSEFSRDFLFKRELCCVEVAGRPRLPATRAAVAAELAALHRTFKGTVDTSPDLSIVGTRHIEQPWDSRAAAIAGLMFVGLTLVLFVACANVGNVQLARLGQRQHELLVRMALGAGRARIARQLLAESVLLTLAATAGALALASAFGVGLTRWMSARYFETGFDLSPDWRVATGCLGVTAIAVVATGLGPGLRVPRRFVSGSRSVSAPRGRVRAWLLAIQVGLSAVLIVGASLLARGLLTASSVHPGFDAEGVARILVNAPRGQVTDAQSAAIGGALRAGLATAGSPTFAAAGFFGNREDVLAEPSISIRSAWTRTVSPDYFRLLGVPLREGRFLRPDDPPAAVVVNESFAKRAWPDRSAIGATFVAGSSRTVVGVVGDMLTAGMEDRATPAMFERGEGEGQEWFVRRAPAIEARVREIVKGLEPNLIVTVEPLSRAFDRRLGSMRAAVGFASGLGMIALTMASVGIFGVFTLAVEERRREIGIRLALGAADRSIVRLMVVQGGRALGAGFALGFGIAGLAAPFLRSYLAGLGPHDPLAFLLAATVLTAAATIAMFVPMRRAIRVDPAITLRTE